MRPSMICSGNKRLSEGPLISITEEVRFTPHSMHKGINLGSLAATPPGIHFVSIIRWNAMYVTYTTYWRAGNLLVVRWFPLVKEWFLLPRH